MSKVITRFAPSDTGLMHIANLRVAIFNWIFAKQNQGKFYLRIENTDVSRSKEEYQQNIFEILSWMQLNFDGPIIKQSDRLSIYKKYVDTLLKNQQAYFCLCDQLPEAGKCPCRQTNHQQGVVRFKTPTEGFLEYKDLVFGKLSIKCAELEDFALLRSDGSPTYCLAVVIDDYEMEITHVIRGEDHRTNTFKQILIYQALNFKIPIFAHLSMIKGADGKKLSKRHCDTSAESYRQKGLVPDALFNILLKLGWGYENEEMMDRDRILEIFDFKDVRKAPCTFDEKKLWSFSGKFLRKYNYIEQLNLDLPENFLKTLYDEIAKRCKNLCEIRHIFLQIYNYAPEKIENSEIMESIKSILINNFDNFKDQIENLDKKTIIQTLRINLTGMQFSPDVFVIMSALGKEKVMQRLYNE